MAYRHERHDIWLSVYRRSEYQRLPAGIIFLTDQLYSQWQCPNRVRTHCPCELTMRFSILHISDLHRDLKDDVGNGWLLDSLARDFEQYNKQDPKIMTPTLCIVSGDLVYGVKPGTKDAANQLAMQYAEAEEFLVGLAERFFDGNRGKIVISPGNHDICFDDVMGSCQRIEIPTDQEKKARLVDELFVPKSRLRWSWRELCFFKIADEDRYRNRFRNFSIAYESFYQGRRKFPLAPEQQYGVFDFPDLGFSVVALNSCYNNDPLSRAGAFHPAAFAEGCRALRRPERNGWLTAAVWHHNVGGGPTQDDYLDTEFLQLLIDAGVSLSFHGHQHLPECVDERYRIGPSPRKITIISASTLCAEPGNLKPGVPRSYNVVELDTDALKGRVHQRHMVNKLFNLPVWGPGHFIATNSSFIDFDICKPLVTRPVQLDVQLALEQAERLLGSHHWGEALDALVDVKDVSLARPLIVKVLGELGDARRTIAMLWPPLTNAEAVMLGAAILESGTREEAGAFVRLEFVSGSMDASVSDILHRVRERRLR